MTHESSSDNPHEICCLTFHEKKKETFLSAAALNAALRVKQTNHSQSQRNK